uniref:Methyltransferase domain-containing protein n=1 Tax=Candidatus Kentrum sp. LPFa TaxID=2126335 RepID=A0A450X4H8_9GAMM|nr:MAG: Methyltransferase domain-containing protein [Candidatus Kentron sp. LPFa]
MKTQVENFLFRHPELYETAYPADNALPDMCRRLFERHLGAQPASILDIGCGTGREINALSETCPDCVGIDHSQSMLEFARSKYSAKYPGLTFEIGDMFSLRLGRVFDAITCLGGGMLYALSHDEIDKTLRTFAAHARAGALLILETFNGARYLSANGFREHTEFDVRLADGVKGKGLATYSFDRRQQHLIRKRVWEIPGMAPMEDYCAYRLFFLMELEHRLAENGFEVVGMFDNKKLEESDLSGEWLYVAALFRNG